MAISDSSQKLWKKILSIAIAVIFAFASMMGLWAWYRLTHRGPLVTYENDADHFKYASIGTEANLGIPYWIWVVLPRLFPEKLPGAGGYTSLGLTWEEGNEMPIGLTKEAIGIDRVGMNCAICHVGTVREDSFSNPQFLLGAPTTKFDLQRYNQFFSDCANDPRFTAGFILPEIEYNHHLSLFEKQLYRFWVIPRTRKTILQRQDSTSWIQHRPPFGPGRSDLNALKINLLNLPDDQTVGNSDVMAIWQPSQTDTSAFYSDGLNSSLHETVLSSALRMGAMPRDIHRDSLLRIENYLKTLSPPSFPFFVDSNKVKQGETIFEQNCASCHTSQSETGRQVIPIEEIKTDSNRLNHWSQLAAEGMNQMNDFSQFRKTNGYVAPSLDGIWTRAPYLHNGSVPNLTALLRLPEQRPNTFYRGYDVYDPEHVGFESGGNEAESLGFHVQTSVQGNSAEGHEFGMGLSNNEKQDLIEYLKTL